MPSTHRPSFSRLRPSGRSPRPTVSPARTALLDLHLLTGGRRTPPLAASERARRKIGAVSSSIRALRKRSAHREPQQRFTRRVREADGAPLIAGYASSDSEVVGHLRCGTTTPIRPMRHRPARGGRKARSYRPACGCSIGVSRCCACRRRPSRRRIVFIETPISSQRRRSATSCRYSRCRSVGVAHGPNSGH